MCIYNIYHYLYIFHVIISFVPSTEARARHRSPATTTSAVFDPRFTRFIAIETSKASRARLTRRGRCRGCTKTRNPLVSSALSRAAERSMGANASAVVFFLFFYFSLFTSSPPPFRKKEKLLPTILESKIHMQKLRNY